VVAEGYVVIEANTRNGRVSSVKFKRTTTRAPFLEGTQVAVKLRIKLPMSVFDAALAEVDIDVPEELVSTPSVTVLPVR
jgi:hypothetical protein